jgi:hypothetical protein
LVFLQSSPESASRDVDATVFQSRKIEPSPAILRYINHLQQSREFPLKSRLQTRRIIGIFDLTRPVGLTEIY